MPPEHYLALEQKLKQLNNLNNIKSMLHWDSATMMPPGGAEQRSEQLVYLETKTHRLLTSDELHELLNQNEESHEELNDWQKANLKEIKHLVRHAHAIPKILVEELSKATSACEMNWRTSRAANDFKSFAPLLQNVISISQQIAKSKAEVFKFPHMYDGLLDHYDRGRTSATMDQVFAELTQFLPSFIEEVKEHQRNQPPILPITGNYSPEKQYKLGVECMKLLGFDFNLGRLDISNHPFCGGIPGDTRITTRYNTDNFLSALMAVIHETGHALYQNNLPKDYISQPVGLACGLSIHESQSLFLEMQIASSKEFIHFMHPHIVNILGLDSANKAFTADNIYRHITHVKPSLIRVDADEVTYPAHIILRYKLEKAMIEGTLTVNDLPEAWNEEMKKLLGITSGDNKDGCMQDIHWPAGLIGYFPTYSLGAIIAAQLASTISTQLGDISRFIKIGDFTTVVSWLKENIHSQGSRYSSNALIERATGSQLDTSFYINYLRKKYL